MPSVVHFAPSLGAGALLIAKSMVNTQVTGLVEVSVDYICRSADLPTQVAKFFLDAPPPIFPSKTISTSSLAQGKLFMVNYGVTDQYGIATINARYAGVTARPIKPFATFEYSNFAVAVPVYVGLSGQFGSQMFVGLEVDNDFVFPSAPMTVAMRGRAEAIGYTFATLSANQTPELPQPTDPFAELELVPNAINYNTDKSGRFGDVLTENPTFSIIGAPPPPPATVTAFEVLQYAAASAGLPGTGPSEWFGGLTVAQWQERGVVPRVFYQTSREVQSITPSVYVREIKYAPLVRGT
jgi:hypothetical protein